ncbi:hypothetical protein QEZ52_10495 [Aliisedimentitalea scapharcae]|uniref:YCII-related domain-containing protein n=1 Tax=Aliisedimentitalea scapharcae TaxID=1524259 RepID=A0ABZ2XNT1_9RHOB|nr:hypothetical protein K3727_10590 [Rhodobacteraceae bacterium M382]
MTLWSVTFEDAPEMVRIRGNRARRLAHIDFVAAHPELTIGGEMALTPHQDFPGAIWTVNADSRQAVEQLIHADPYYIPSLRRYEIFGWGRISQSSSVAL